MNYQNYKVIEPVSFFRAVAREALKNRWKLAILTGFLFMLANNFPVSIFNEFFGMNMNSEMLSSSYGNFGNNPQFLDMMEQYGSVVSPLSGFYALLTGGAFALGFSIFVIHIIRRAEAGVGLVFSGFGNYLRSLVLFILLMLIILGILFAAIFISATSVAILGAVGAGLTFIFILAAAVIIIIVGLSYSMAYYILADNPKMSAVQCMKASRMMMRGNKGKLFILYLSFIGWGLLYMLASFIIGMLFSPLAIAGNMVALNIAVSIAVCLPAGILYVYLYTSEAAFYEKVSGISAGIPNPGLYDESMLNNQNPSQGPDHNQNKYLNDDDNNNGNQ